MSSARTWQERLGDASITAAQIDRLVDAACAARQHAHAPYSKFQVGAALAAVDGTLFSGCNVENASYGGTICAERTAASAAVVAGMRRWNLLVIATGGAVPPCGICRQFLAEFEPALRIVLYDIEQGSGRLIRLNDLYPEPFLGPRTG